MSHPDVTLQRSTRNADWVRGRLTAWLATVLDPDAQPEVVLHSGVDSNGMSSETILFALTHTVGGVRRTEEHVARVAPAPADLPVFATYRMRDQYETMRLAGASAGLPVPKVGLIEESGEVLGTPFFLMERVDGLVPPDNPPYPFGGNWLYDATPEQQRTLQHSTVEILAKLHSIPDAAQTFAFLDPACAGHHGETPLRRNLAKTRAWYEFAAAGAARSPLVERGLDWLEANTPRESTPVLIWGDARIGNTMYREFTPVAVLDWEMASLGPREMDIAWMIFAHEVFQEISTFFGLPGMPEFLAERDVVATYRDLTGVELGDLTWHRLHASVQWACVFLRTSARQIHFGEIERPEDPESAFYHRPLFERILNQVGA